MKAICENDVFRKQLSISFSWLKIKKNFKKEFKKYLPIHIMDINNTGAGKTVRCKGYTAFLPDPLPPPLNWPLALINALSEADHILGRLSAEGSKLPNPHLLIQPFITREAVLSSRIEGTQATVEEILASDAGGIVARNPNDLGRVLN